MRTRSLSLLMSSSFIRRPLLSRRTRQTDAESYKILEYPRETKKIAHKTLAQVRWGEARKEGTMGDVGLRNPFVLRVGQVMSGFGAGCGLGIGVGVPIPLGMDVSLFSRSLQSQVA
jgi:hypothetical protein